MRQFTVRGLPEEVEKKIMKEAADKGISLNKAVVSLLSGGGPRGRGKKGEGYRDLDPFFGIWKQAEGEEFDRQLELQREVDQDLWKKSG
jgi:hypothetical protein